MPETQTLKPKNNFRFWFPIEDVLIEKAVGKDGVERQAMVLGGIASTNRTDTDKESIAQNFDLSYLKARGIVNWNHSKDPEDVIGEPLEAKMMAKGLYIKSMLYPESKKAKKVYELADMLRKSGTRRLGYSIEGKAMDRDPMDPSIITRALVTNIALTISPKNTDSIVDIIKGNFTGWSDDELAPKSESFDFDANGGKTHLLDITREDGTRILVDHDLNINIVAKGMDTTNARALIREDLDGKIKDQTGVDKTCLKKSEDDTSTYLSRDEVIERLLTHSVIDFEKANQIFEILNNFAMSDKTKITDEMLEKALANVNKLTGDESGKTADGAATSKEKTDEIAKAVTASNGTTAGNTKTAKAKDEDEGDNEDATGQDNGKAKDVPKVGKAMKKSEESEEYVTKADFNNFMKSVNDSLRDIATITKSGYDIAKANNEELQGIQDSLDETPGRKSLSKTKAVERNFEKGVDGADLNSGGKGTAKQQISVTRHKNKVIEMMDRVTFKGGQVNQEFAKGLTLFESSGEIHDSAFVKAVEDEFGIQLAK